MARKDDTAGEEPLRAPRRPLSMILLSILLGVEAALAAWLTIALLIDIITAGASSTISAIALLVLALLALAWVGGTLLGAVRLRSWSRSSAVTIQLMVLAFAVGSFEGIILSDLAGFPLLFLALAGVVLALLPPSVRSTSRG